MEKKRNYINACITFAGFLGRSVRVLPRCQWWPVDAAITSNQQAVVQSQVGAVNNATSVNAKVVTPGHDP